MTEYDYTATKEMSNTKVASNDGDVVFYQVKAKFVDSEKSVPEETKDVLYYTLSIGHHTGVIDCLEEKLRIPKAQYEDICASLDGEAKYKLEGAVRNTEIQIEKHNLPPLIDSLNAALNSADTLDDVTKTNISNILDLFKVLEDDTAAYIMARLRY